MSDERINLLPAALVRSRAVKRRVHVWFSGGCLAVCMTGAATAAYAWSTVEPTEVWRESLDAERAKAADLRGVIEARSEDIGMLSRELQMRLRITACPHWAPLLRAIARCVGPRAEVTALALQPEDRPGARARSGGASSIPASYTMLLTGVTDSATSLSEMLLDLAGLAPLHRVELISSRAFEDKGGVRRIAFDINCTLRDVVASDVGGDERRSTAAEGGGS